MNGLWTKTNIQKRRLVRLVGELDPMWCSDIIQYSLGVKHALDKSNFNEAFICSNYVQSALGLALLRHTNYFKPMRQVAKDIYRTLHRLQMYMFEFPQSYNAAFIGKEECEFHLKEEDSC